MAALLGFLLAAVATFLILLVLVQRGRGGGLTGALGGMGGQSAFGAKAGDVFTKLTAATALIWILLSVGTLKLIGRGSSPLEEGLGGSQPVGVGNVEPGTEGATPGGATPGGATPSSTPPANGGTQGGTPGGAAGGEEGGSPAPSGADR